MLVLAQAVSLGALREIALAVGPPRSGSVPIFGRSPLDHGRSPLSKKNRRVWTRFRTQHLTEPLCLLPVLVTEPKESEDVVPHSSDRACAALGRRFAELAVQPQLGLCSQ